MNWGRQVSLILLLRTLEFLEMQSKNLPLMLAFSRPSFIAFIDSVKFSIIKT